MIESIVFDIDGTLLDHEQALLKSLTNLYSRIEKKIPRSTFDEFFSIWKAKSNQYINEYLDGQILVEQQRILRVQTVLKHWDYNLSSDEAMEIFRIYLAKYEQNWTLYTDTLPCLAMTKKFPLGVVSDGEGEQQRKKLAITNIDSYFKSIIISGETGLRKPHPNLFKKSAMALNLPLDEILYVGDHLEIDTLGAINTGMHGVWINRTKQINTHFNIRMISQLTELPQIIEEFH